MLKIKKPNSICKNINCRKLFYACAYCTHKLAWRAICCSEECYAEYNRQVAEARANKEPINLWPERIDMTVEEVEELITKTPIEKVIKITNEELKDYSEDVKDIGLNATIDKINDEIKIIERNIDFGDNVKTIRRMRKIID